MGARKKDRADVGRLLLELREACGLTQAEVAERGGGVMPRSELSAIENGTNLATSWRVRNSLATAFGVDLAVMSEYLDGKRSLEDTAPKELLTARKGNAPNAGRTGRPPKSRAQVAALPSAVPPAPKKGATSAVPQGARGAAALNGALSRYPNLERAVQWVAEDMNFDSALVRRSAEELARREKEQTDQSSLTWAALLKDEVAKLRSSLQINPLRIANLAAAIDLIAEGGEATKRELTRLAARVVATLPNPMDLSTVAWIRALDAERQGSSASGHAKKHSGGKS